MVAAALVCVLITCATDLDLDHQEHHTPQIVELDTPQALADASLPAEFSGRAKESSTDVVALGLPVSLSRFLPLLVSAALSLHQPLPLSVMFSPYNPTLACRSPLA